MSDKGTKASPSEKRKAETMKTLPKNVLLVAAGVVLAAGFGFTRSRSPQGACCPLLGSAAVLAAEVSATNAPAKAAVPRLLDLGAGKCIPCKMMAPILEELKKEYAGAMEVEFIDVWKKPEAAKPYDIKLIPTQIFYATSGRELFRHEGFISKADILAKWKELGVELKAEKRNPKAATK